VRFTKQLQIAGLVLGAAACGGGSTTGNSNGNQNPPTQPGGTPAPTANIEIDNNFYSPNSVLLAASGTVTWTWVGDNGHSVTPDGSPAFSPTAPVSYPPHTLVVTFPNTGDYRFFCLVHGVNPYGGTGGMVGAIYVR